MACLKRGKKRKTIPNPNRRFITLGKALATGKAIPKVGGQAAPVIVDSDSEEEVDSEAETFLAIEIKVAPQRTTRLRRLIRSLKNVEALILNQMIYFLCL